MGVLRLYPSSYTLGDSGATYQNMGNLLNHLNPEDASTGSTYCAMVAKYKSYQWVEGEAKLFFTIPSNIDDLTITKISLKGRMATYGSHSTTKGMLTLTEPTGAYVQATHYSSSSEAQSYMAGGASNYSVVEDSDESHINYIISYWKQNKSFVKIASGTPPYNERYNPDLTYFSGIVLDLEYEDPPSQGIKLGTSKLKDAFMGNNVIRKIYKGAELLFKHLNIPEEYQEVEYVTFHGTNSGTSSTEYIDTGVVPSATKGFFLDADVIGASGCTGWGSGANSAATIFRGNSTGLRIQADNSSAAKTYSVTGRHVWTIDYYNQRMGYDNTFDSISPVQYGVLNFYLGAWYEAGTTYYGMGGNVYSFKIYDSGNLSVNYIPCYRKSDGVIGFYDTVNNVFKVNNGGGTFTKGPDV